MFKSIAQILSVAAVIGLSGCDFKPVDDFLRAHTDRGTPGAGPVSTAYSHEDRAAENRRYVVTQDPRTIQAPHYGPRADVSGYLARAKAQRDSSYRIVVDRAGNLRHEGRNELGETYVQYQARQQRLNELTMKEFRRAR